MPLEIMGVKSPNRMPISLLEGLGLAQCIMVA